MKRFLFLLATILAADCSFAQDCSPLECIIGAVFTTQAQSLGQCFLDVPAINLVAHDFSNCPQPVEAALYRRAEVLAAGDQFTPDFQERDTLLLTSEDNEPTIIDLYFRDGSGLIQHCESYILIQHPQDCMSDDDPINGQIRTNNGEAIAHVDVMISDDLTATYTTNGDGAYPLFFLQPGESYTITPQRNDNPLNGISTFDVVLLYKHILGILPLDDPYKLIAADVNQSENVSILDAIHMRKLLLGHYEAFPNVPSWRFVPADYEFPTPTNPWAEAFPSQVIFAPLTESFNGADFIGIKMGDLNGSAQAN